MDFLLNGSQVKELKKTEEFYIKTEDGREIIATCIQTKDSTAWMWKGGNLSGPEQGELKTFLTTLE